MPRARVQGTTRDRIVAAAAQVFSARGFDGAKVDRIALKARVNKAMLYYHFRSKADLYRQILRDQFGAVANAVEVARRDLEAPEDQLRRFVATIAQETVTRPEFPAMWLRELGEGGRHLDGTIVAEMRRVIEVLGRILAAGRRTAGFADVNPFVMHMSIVAPLALFAVSAPVRDRLKHLVPGSLVTPDHDAVVAHVQASALALLKGGGIAVPGPTFVHSPSRSMSR